MAVDLYTFAFIQPKKFFFNCIFDYYFNCRCFVVFYEQHLYIFLTWPLHLNHYHLLIFTCLSFPPAF